MPNNVDGTMPTNLKVIAKPLAAALSKQTFASVLRPGSVLQAMLRSWRNGRVSVPLGLDRR